MILVMVGFSFLDTMCFHTHTHTHFGDGGFLGTSFNFVRRMKKNKIVMMVITVIKSFWNLTRDINLSPFFAK